MIVGDASFADKVTQKIENEQVNAEWALAEVQEELQARFASFDDDYLRERTADVKDVAERVLVNLQGIAHHELSEIEHDVIIIADDLTPSDTDPLQPPAGRRLRHRGRRPHVAHLDHRQVAVHARRHRRAAPDQDRRQRRAGDRRRLRGHGRRQSDAGDGRRSTAAACRATRKRSRSSSRTATSPAVDQGPSPDLAAGEHRAGRRARRRDQVRRGGHRPLPHRVPLHLDEPRPADRGRALRHLPQAGRGDGAELVRHPHVRPRRQEARPRGHGLEGRQPGPRPARAAPLHAAPRHVQAPSCARCCARRRSASSRSCSRSSPACRSCGR